MSILDNPVYIWLIVGFLLIVIEVLITPGVGLFLAGMGSICTSFVILERIISPDDYLTQFACFFGFTIVWTAALWKVVKKWRTGKGTHYSNIIGSVATVGQAGLKHGIRGQVVWSGTLMNAELDKNSPVDSLPAGALVEIREVSGNILRVIPKREE